MAGVVASVVGWESCVVVEASSISVVGVESFVLVFGTRSVETSSA